MALLPKIKLKALVSFPAAVIDGNGINVEKTGGQFQFSLAFDDFAPPLLTVPDLPHQNLLMWNSVTGVYALASAGLLSGVGDPFLLSIANLGTAANKMIYTTGVDAAAETTLTPFARTLLDDADGAAMKATIGVVDDPTTLLASDNTWTGVQGYAETVVSPTTPIIWNVDTAPVATVALNAGATTMNAPTNVVAGRVYTIRFVANAAGNSTVAWNTNFDFNGGTVPAITSAANAIDRFTFIGRPSGILEEIGRSQNIGSP